MSELQAKTKQQTLATRMIGEKEHNASQSKIDGGGQDVPCLLKGGGCVLADE